MQWIAVVRICVWAALVTSIVQKHELLAHCVYVQAVEICTLCNCVYAQAVVTGRRH